MIEYKTGEKYFNSRLQTCSHIHLDGYYNDNLALSKGKLHESGSSFRKVDKLLEVIKKKMN